jgi:uncharacterized protein YggE
MRTFLPIVAALGVAPLALAQDSKADRVITVSGAATVYAKPDTARIHYGVRVTEPSADAVRDVLGKTTKAMDEAVAKLKLSSVAVSTAPMGVRQGGGNNNNLPVPVPPGGAPGGAPGIGTLTGFTSHTATITNPDSDKLRADVEAFLKAITEAGANTSGGEPKIFNFDFVPGSNSSDGPKVLLSRADDSAARDEALQKAVEKALKGARAIAKGLGVDPASIKVVSVSDAEPDKLAADPQNPFNVFEGLAASPPPTSAGQVEVRVRVVVKCSY